MAIVENPNERVLGADNLVVTSHIDDLQLPPGPAMLHTITAEASAGGSITPSGSIRIKEGEDQIFTITPDSSYMISDVIVDSLSIGVTDQYTFKNVSANHTISATFRRRG